MSIPVIGAIVMIGSGGDTPAEHLVQAARLAATRDLIAQLQNFEVHPIVVAARDVDSLAGIPGILYDPDVPATSFHFGERLASLITRYNLDHALYFGGGSAPLLDDNTLNMIALLLERAGSAETSSIPAHIALTNNKHSSDWLALTCAGEALDIIRSTDRDNSLAWLLDSSGNYDVRVVSGIRPATAMDIDTPTDLAVLAHHPERKPRLASVLADSPALNSLPVEQIAAIAARPEAHLMLAGRVAPLAWQALNKATQCWIRVYSEERGMVASGRLARGETRSLLGELLSIQGPQRFFETLASMTEAAIIDSRPLMASQGHWPDDADRFASDLFQVSQIKNSWLQEFTQAAAEAPIPILLGGHSIVAGGLYALTEIIEHKKAAHSDSSL